MKKSTSPGDSWIQRIQDPAKKSESFLSHWDFRQKDGTPYYTIDPENIPDEWKNSPEPRSVFEVPEIWYAVERLKNKYFDSHVRHEVSFCKTLWEKYSESPVEYILEACCGICPHGSTLAKGGISVVGVDSSAGMVKAVNSRAEIQDLNIRAYQRDVFQFSIPGSSPDGAILLSSVFPVPYHNRTDNRALINQLRSVGYYIKRGGLYIIDCGIPEPPKIVTEESVSQPVNYTLDFAEVSVRTLTFRTKIDTWETPYTYYYTVEYPGGRITLVNNSSKSFVSASHLQALAEMSGIFELEAFHHWGNPEPGLNQGGGSYVAVLRRK